MSFEKQVLQIGKDTLAAIIFCMSVGLIWIYTHEVVLAALILALFVDVFFAAWAMALKKFTMMDIKDFLAVLGLSILVTTTFFIGDIHVYRVAYSVVFGVFGLIDLTCVSLHLSKTCFLYTNRLYPESHNSIASVVDINDSYKGPFE